MHLWIITLYALGILLPVIGTFCVLPRMLDRVSDSIRKDVESLNHWRRSELNARRHAIYGTNPQDPDPEGTKAGQMQTAQAAVDAEYRRRAQKMHVSAKLGLSFGSNDSQVSIDTLHHVARVNAPTAIVVLLGGACATAASIMSLYLP